MTIIALAKPKGGVGKSTLAVNIAGVLAPKAVLVDADPLTGRNLEAWLETVLALGEPFVVIDLPPMLGDATAAALAICDLAVVPVSPSGADLRATNRAVELIREAREQRGEGRPAALLVPSKVDRRTAAGAEIEAVRMTTASPWGRASPRGAPRRTRSARGNGSGPTRREARGTLR